MVGEIEPQETRNAAIYRISSEAALGVYPVAKVNGVWYAGNLTVPLYEDSDPTGQRLVLLDPRDASKLPLRR